MRRILIGLMIGALAFGSGYAGARVANVTNPMSADLNGGGHIATNLGEVDAWEFQAIRPGESFPTGFVEASSYYVTDSSLSAPVIFSGLADPSASCPLANPGSIYLREMTQPPTTGEVWAKTADPCNWTKLAG